jgi:tRNA 2-thiouridine synthesizing protein C
MKLLFIQSTPPHGQINAQEGLDALLMGSAFTECGLLLIGEGLLQLAKHQDPSVLGMKNFSLTFGALADYGVKHVYCRETDLQRFGLTVEDLVIEVQPVDDESARSLLSGYEQVVNF